MRRDEYFSLELKSDQMVIAGAVKSLQSVTPLSDGNYLSALQLLIS